MTTQVAGETLPVREVGERRLDDYAPVVGEEAIQELRSLALPLLGKRVLHINSSPDGGGVADILAALVPLLNDLGLKAEWRTIKGDALFFDITKKMHNTLQGEPVAWDRSMWDTWLRCNEQNAQMLDPKHDVIIVHDPQPAAILHYLNQRHRNGATKWLWRCHIDLTDASPEIWRRLQPYIRPYDAAEFSMEGFINGDYTGPRTFVCTPGIDPLDPKNLPMDPGTAREILAVFGIDCDRPFMAQISRFDPWKDPLGVIDAYRLARAQVPGLQLVMIGPIAADDPEGMTFFEKTARRAGEDPDIHLLTSFKGVGDREVNAVQTLAAVVVQKSIREGFGLSATGTLWHGKPVIAGRAGGLCLQVIDGETGFLIDTTEECAEKVVMLLKDPALSVKLGERAKEHVRKNFLITRYVRDSLLVYRELLEENTGQGSADPPS
ncbi:MAG: glycosyltransferase [Chloroflexi bacterium]|nr:glycosyltransferase [Chloroflexota bacterium]